MSQDKEAIELIQQSAHIPEMQKALDAAGTIDNMVVLPNDYQVKNLEGNMKFRTSFRFEFRTISIEDFIKYCNDNADTESSAFIDHESMRAKTIFDLGNKAEAGHQRHKALIRLNRLSAYQALLTAGENHHSQQDAADFVEDWADNISIFTSAGDVMSVKEASRAFRDMTIKRARETNSSVDDYAESMSELERIEADNIDKLPSEIQFKCIPYLGFAVTTFKMRVSILTSREKPTYSFRLVRLEAIQEEIAEEFKEKIEQGVKGMKVYLGEA